MHSDVKMRLNAFSPEQSCNVQHTINDCTRKLIKSVFVEFITPIQTEINVQLKALRREVDEQRGKNLDFSQVVLIHSQELDKINA